MKNLLVVILIISIIFVSFNCSSWSRKEKGAAIGLRKVAKAMGYKLNNHGLWKGKKRIAGKTEREIYNALGRPWKKPENR